MASLLDAFVAIASAHAGEPLTPEVTFPDEETAALAVLFENAGSRS